MTRAVVFAYHNVGVRCLQVLLAHGVDVRLVVTHADDPREHIWFESVAALAALHGLPFVTPADPADADLLARIRQETPDFLFSFYYRHVLPAALLEVPPLGALNMHGSLLPRYRGRVPVNWAVIRGERETGASLHYMVAKPDAGDLVDQQAVPILPDDTAAEVFNKVTVAAEMVLDRTLPALLARTAARRPLDLAAGCYFGGRRPEDGRIDWSQPAARVHDLVRGVAPPYPGAITAIDGRPARVLRTTWRSVPTQRPPGTFYVADAGILVACGDGRALRVLELEVDGARVDAAAFRARLGAEVHATA
jgi:methionyl-tRNA formyltransferase